MRGTFFILLLIFQFPVILAQQNVNVFTSNILQPTVTSLYAAKEIDFATVDNHGKLNKNINILDLKNGDLNLKLDVNYSNNCLKLDDWGGAMGLLWSPRFYPIIYREVRGIPDGNSQKIDQLSDWNWADYNTMYDIYESKINHNTAGKDGELDVFHYNINGSSGKFVVYNGQVYLLNYTNKVKIEFGYNFSYFIITDMFGNRYYYGQNDNIEYASISQYCSPDSSPQPFVKTTWFINRIENVNNSNYINFDYDTYMGEYPENYSESKSIKMSIYSGDQPIGDGSGYNLESFMVDGHCVTIKEFKTKYIKKITANNFSVDFSYINRDDIGGKFYKRIDLRDKNGKLINKINFDYSRIGNYLPGIPDIPELGNSTPVRYFLKSIVSGIQQDEVFSFDYYNLSDIPPRFSKGKDILGIYNGKNNQSLLPKEYIESMLPLLNVGLIPPNLLNLTSFPSGIRTPQFPQSSYGLLKTIKHPTKGTEQIFYEPNVIKEVNSSAEKNFYGVRPQKIEINDINGNVTNKKYSYKLIQIDSLNYNLSQTSHVSSFYSENDSFGGYLTDGYLTGYWQCNQGAFGCFYKYRFYQINSEKRYDVNSFQNNFIAYNTITETTNDKKFITSTYNVVEDMPAMPIFGYSNAYLPSYSNNWFANLLGNQYSGEVVNGIYKIRRIHDHFYTFKNEKIFNNFVVHRDYQPQGWNNSTFLSSNLEAYSVSKYLLYSRWFNKQSERITDILEDNQKLVAETYKEFYDVNNFNNLRTITTSLPSGEVMKTEFKYAKNQSPSNDYTQRYMIGIPLETINSKNGIPTNKEIFSYSRDWLGHELMLPALKKTVQIPTINSVAENVSEEVIYNQYDDKGNLIQYTKNGKPVTILYGYNQTLPIAKIEGAYYTGLMNDVGLSTNLTGYKNLNICIQSDLDVDISSEQNLLYALDVFRRVPNLSNYQITTYTYDPLIGITSITPPSGIREVYIYDTANRLKEIREQNHTGRILKEFKYKYKP